MIRIDATYSDFFETPNEEYPWGSAKDASTPESTDGTPYKKRWRNDVIGMMQALFYRAFNGTARVPSNIPDNVKNSDIADAVERIIEKHLDNKWYQVTVKGEETIIPWGTFGRNYNEDTAYSIIAVPAGNYEEILPIGTDAKEDGIHIYVRRLTDGQIKNGTRIVTWGSFVFGERKFGESETMTINIIIKEMSA